MVLCQRTFSGRHLVLYLSFFFQAEDGIRDRNVTGVQTCALPISSAEPAAGLHAGSPVQAGSAASTATVRSGWRSAQATATAAPIDTPPTAIGPPEAAESNASQ